MRLHHTTWPEIAAYLQRNSGIIIPTGSTEQHGPIGLIGTDALCAELIASGAAESADALLAPTLSYTPAPFNMAFPGTMSVSVPLFTQLVHEISAGLQQQGFRHLYFLNGHGANLAPLHACAAELTTQHPALNIRIRSWWDFAEVNKLRADYYGEWEGMHATPSEIAITQTEYRVIAPDASCQQPPRKLSREYIQAHAGDKHGPPEQHRQQFPDGRVGSHSALARPEHGKALLTAAIAAVTADYYQFTAGQDDK